MVARLPQIAAHGFTGPSCFPPPFARDSNHSLDENSAASEASIVGVYPQSVCRSLRVVRCTRTEGAGAMRPPAQVHFGGRSSPAPNLRRSELA